MSLMGMGFPYGFGLPEKGWLFGLRLVFQVASLSSVRCGRAR